MTFAVVFPPRFDVSSIVGFHRFWGWVAIVLLGLAGLWGIGLAIARRSPGRAFGIAAGVAIVAMLVQVGLGLWSFGVMGIDPGNQHVFYGVVTLFTFAFAYIYRSQFSKRPALSYGLMLLFVMGLGIRGLLVVGQSFGA
jgi:hypothetical protein